MDVELRLKRVRRWLERLTRAVEASMWDSALAESQCLEAEARSLRDHVSHLAAGAPAKAGARWSPALVGAAMALLALLASVEPLAVGDGVPVPSASVPREERPVPDVKLVDAVPPQRLDPASPPVRVVSVAPARAVEGVARSRQPRVAESGVSPKGSHAVPPAERPGESRPSLGLDEALILLRAGQRALEGQ